MTSYSLSDVVNDGAIRGPRWVLHLIKLAQHAAPAFGLWCLTGRPLLAAVIAGPIVYAVILIRKAYYCHRDHYRPNLVDWVHDACFPLAVTAGARIAVGDLRIGCVELLVAVLVWLTLHTRAVP